MILPEADIDSALLSAEHIRGHVADFEISLPDGSKKKLSFTGGIAIFPTHAESASELLRAADEALYRAKRKARGTFLTAEERTKGPVIPK
jgi:diguanylate cyclase (GGDEF)-like protein